MKRREFIKTGLAGGVLMLTGGRYAAQEARMADARIEILLDEPIGRIRGRWGTAHGARVMPTFHPAFLLRSPERKKDVWEDMKLVRDYLAQK